MTKKGLNESNYFNDDILIIYKYILRLLDHNFELERVDNPSNSTNTEEQNTVYGLARIGTRTALNFAFAFLRRAWRSGNIL